jgi:predicted nucleic acid-binding protein
VRLVLDADVVIGALDGSDPHHARARALFVAWQKDGAHD